MDLIKHTLIFLFITLPLQLVSIVVLPFILPFIPKDRETLPAFVRWFDNAEIPLGIGSKDDGLAGPAYYREPSIASYKKVLRTDYLSLLLCRYIWLAFRNPLNYFQYKAIGVKISGPIIIKEKQGDDTVGNKEGDHAGVYYIKGNQGYWQYYKVIKLGSTRCLRIRLGYKDPDENTGYCQFVYTINLAKYEGV